ncbi:cytochrome P450 [Paludibaculum fermentans]|uniref:Cytochrome P450 n=1 Tax=Paludibaculum fermentans TaxID=1473598 RepID=A0A7S7SJ93_PALFE|nr:cytochrome P450 [Paludibaculum fermentans]QOY86453.1 cytochrome P450 [Paludibaculum fermentans]
MGTIADVRPAVDDAGLSLYNLLDPEVLDNPYPLYARLRSEDPVHWDPFLHAWVVTRYDDVVQVLHKFIANRTPTPELLEAMGAPELSEIAEVMVKQMLFMDAAAHTRIRQLASYAFTPARIKVLRDHIESIAERLVSEMEAKGSFDLIGDFAAPLPAIVTAEMLGVPTSDYRQLKDWSFTFSEMLGNFQHNPDRSEAVLEALRGMIKYFRNAIAVQKEYPTEGLVRSFMDAEADGDRFTEEEIVANCILTMVGGLETTTNLIGSGILTLMRHRDQYERLCQDPSLIPGAVEELLRFESPSQHTARLAPADIEMGGKLIKERQAVIAVMGAANRDPERFPNPDELDFTRSPNRHVAFGWGAHFCFGAALARMEAHIAYGLLTSRFPNLRRENDAPVEWRDNLGLRGLKELRMNSGKEGGLPA